MEKICIFVRSKIFIEKSDCWSVTIHRAGKESLPSLVNGQIVDNISKKIKIKFTSTMQWLLSFFVHGQYYNQIMRNSSLTHGPARIAQAPGLCSKPVEQSPPTSHKIFKSTLMSPSSEPVKRTSPARTAHSMSSECLSQSAATAEIWSRCVWFSDPFYLACF